MPPPTLSILIPTYKRADLLKRCLQSVVRSGVSMQEVVIGDDGGTPETQQVCAEFSSVLPIVCLPAPKKGSLASNLTRLCKAAKADWVLLLHDDDFLTSDHSTYPASFADKCDFHFTDHWVTNEAGEVDEEESRINSLRYGRDTLREGPQSSPFELMFGQRVCMDGFYARRELVQRILPDEELGPVADYFWVWALLNAGIRIHYNPVKSFAYQVSPVGLTAAGMDFSSLLKGFRELAVVDPEHADDYNRKISYYSWFLVNRLLRKGLKGEAWNRLTAIGFRYRHSKKHQILLPVQLLLMVLPAAMVDRFKSFAKRHLKSRLWRVPRSDVKANLHSK